MSELEIHHINVSQGDSTLIINRDIVELEKAIDKSSFKSSKPIKKEDFLPFAISKKISLKGTVRKAMLIDAGDAEYGGDVAGYLAAQGVVSGANFFTVATHYHADHVDGFRDVFYKNFDKSKKLSEQDVNFVPAHMYHCGDLKKWDATFTRDSYRRMTADLLRRGGTKESPLEINKTCNDLGKDSNNTPIYLRVIAANGSISKNGSTTIELAINPKKTVDQNARSIVLVLEYGDFRYFAGADIGGTGEEDGGNFGNNKDTRKKDFRSSHPDIETGVTAVLPKIYQKDAKRMNTAAGHMCVQSANHHGSASSNDVFFIEQIQPTVVACSAGVRASFHYHPTQQFFQRIDDTAGYSPKWQEPKNSKSSNPTIVNTVKGYYVTEMAIDGIYKYKGKKTPYTRTLPKGKILGDIIVRPILQVDPTKLDFKNTITVQIYGTGVHTDSTVAGYTLRPNQAATQAPLYPIGPYTHICNKH
jgi:beta-lactamase superfamily II metal-dependent hydrolase